MWPGRPVLNAVQLAPYLAGAARRRGGRAAGLSVTGGALVLLFLTVNSGMEIYQSLEDISAVFSVASAYFNLVFLYICVALYVQAPPTSRRRSKLRAAVWVLTMALTFHYVFEVMGKRTKPMTLNGAMLLWAMPAGTGIAVIFVFFQEERLREPREDEENRDYFDEII